MSTKNILLAGASAIVLAGAFAVPASATQGLGSFTFGDASNAVNISSSTGTTSNGAITSLSSQINNALSISSSLSTNQADINAGTSTAAGPASVSTNQLTALTVANQFTGVSGASYNVDPSLTPAGGAATIGTSQINVGSSNGSATLGAIGTAGTTINPGAEGGSITFSRATSTSSWTVATNDTGLATYNSLPLSLGSTLTATQLNALSNVGFAQGIDGGYSTGALSYVAGSSHTTDSISVSGQSSSTTSVAGAANSVTFTAGGTYGAPVTVSSNTLSAQLSANLVNEALSGKLPTASSIAVSPASAIITGVASSDYTGSIATSAPLSVTNVQQNVMFTSGTTMSAGNYNSTVAATFTGTGGQSGGPVQASTNAITATAYGNGATLASQLTGGGGTALTTGVSVFNVQGNIGFTNPESAPVIFTANNQNGSVYIQAASGEGASLSLQQFVGDSATLAGNTIASTVRLNTVAQTLSTDSGIAAGAELAGPSSLILSPTNNYSAAGSTAGLTTSAATVTANAGYLNFGYQNNYGAVSASATTANSVIGYFGGMSNGTATVAGNIVQGLVTGNYATANTTMASIDSNAATITGQYQTNSAGTNLSAAVNGPLLMITDYQQLTQDITDPNYTTVAPAASASNYTNANLVIGGLGAGNAITAQVVGNNAAASATLNQTGDTAVLSTSTFTTAGTGIGGTEAGSLSTLTANSSVMLLQDNPNFGLYSASVTTPNAATANTMQIDAVNGLSAGTATIGYNTVNANAVGNVGSAALALSSNANTLIGGAGVITQQGNSSGSIVATLDPVYGIAGVIDAGFLTNATASIDSNTLGALAVGNSAQGSIALTGNVISNAIFNTISRVLTGGDLGQLTPQTVSADFLLGNVQNNVGVTLSAANVASSASTGLVIGVAGSISNSTASVASNSLTATTVASEYVGTVTTFVSNDLEGQSELTMGIVNTQLNQGGTTAVAALANTILGVGIVDALDGVRALDGSGLASTDANATISNSTVSVTGNNLSSAARLNTASLTATGIGTYGDASLANVASASIVLGSNTTATSVTAQASLTNVQQNVGTIDTNYPSFTSVATSFSTYTLSLMAAAAVADGVMGISWPGAGSVAGSNFSVSSNDISATVAGNTSNLAASLGGGGSVYAGGLALTNSQTNTTTAASDSTMVSVVALETIAAYGTGSVSGSQVNTDSNSVLASTTLNTATQTLTAPSGTVLGGSLPAILPTPAATATAGSVSISAYASAAVDTFQANGGVDALAIVDKVNIYNEGTAFSNSTLTTNANALTASAIANTATTTITLPVVDSSLSVANWQSNNTTDVGAQAEAIKIGTTVTTTGVNTVALTNSPTSVNNNLVSVIATVNNYAATATGLGQDGNAIPEPANMTSSVNSQSLPQANTLNTTSSSPTVALVNAQYASATTATGQLSNVTIGIDVANASSSGTTVASNSPLTVTGNTATSAVNGNIASLATSSNGAGGATINGGIGIASAQSFLNSTASASTSTVNIGVNAAGFSSASQQVANSPVTVSSNTVGAMASANNATLSMGFSSVLNAAGSGTSGQGVNGAASTIGSTGVVTAYGDYTLANNQVTSGTSAVTALNSGTTIGYNGSAVSSPVNVSSNYVYASGYGNNATMSTSAPLSTGAVTQASFQSNTGTTISATVTGAVVQANFAGGATAAGAVNVNGNVIHAQAVGNALAATISH